MLNLFFDKKNSVECIFRIFLVNRQLNDKERVAAALENTQLVSVVTKWYNFIIVTSRLFVILTIL
jgi:predicted neuraminidase